MNDATGLVAFKFALAALTAGTFSIRAAAFEFVLVAAGGLMVGLLAGAIVGWLRDLLLKLGRSDSLLEITLSLLTPYAAYLAGEAVHVSGILAVVAAGLYSGWRDPVRMTAEARQLTWSVWRTVLFWLTGTAFVLLGLQFPQLVAGVDGAAAWPRMVLCALVIAGTAMIVRLAWFFPGAYLPFVFSRHMRRTEKRPSWRTVLVGGWAGARGAVTLAAALSIPLNLDDGTAFPGRNIVIFLAFGLIATTLLVQGTTLEWLIGKLGICAEGLWAEEEHKARTAAVQAGLDELRAVEPTLSVPEQLAALRHVIAEYEQRLAELVEEGPKQANAHVIRTSDRKFRLAALEAERRTVDTLWQQREITDDVHRPLQHLLDHEEAMLRGGEVAD